MAKRMILMLTVTVAVLAVLGFLKFQQFQAAASQAAGFQPPPEAVTTIVAQPEQWPDTLAVIGTTAAVQGVTVSADLPGLVASPPDGVALHGRWGPSPTQPHPPGRQAQAVRGQRAT